MLAQVVATRSSATGLHADEIRTHRDHVHPLELVKTGRNRWLEDQKKLRYVQRLMKRVCNGKRKVDTLIRAPSMIDHKSIKEKMHRASQYDQRIADSVELQAALFNNNPQAYVVPL